MFSTRPLFFSPIFVLIFFFLISLAIQFSASGLTSQLDEFYHLAHSKAYWQGNELNYPILTTLDKYPSDPYFGYHLLFAPAFYFEGETALMVAKIIHSFLYSLLYFLVFLIARALALERGFGKSEANRFGALTVFWFFVLHVYFSLRMSVIRPYVAASALFFLASYFAYKRRLTALFFVSALSPIFYSASFLVVLPAVVYSFCRFVFDGIKTSARALFQPVIISLAGLVAGIIVHPASFNYLYNGYYLSIMAQVLSLLGKIREAGELASASLFVFDLPWLLVYGFCFSVFVLFVIKEKSFSKISFASFYFFTLSLFLFLLSFISMRFGEYFPPLAAVFCALAFLDMNSARDSLRSADNKFFVSFGNFFQEIAEGLNSNFAKRVALPFVFLVLFGAGLLGHLNWTLGQPDADVYKGVADFLRQDSEEGAVVFYPFFHYYPRLVFYNDTNRFSAGFGNIFSYAYSPELYRLRDRMARGDNLCVETVCLEANLSVYEAVRDYFGASYVFLDLSPKIGEMKQTVPKWLYEEIKKDRRFRQVYQDPLYSFIKVYKL